MGSNPISSTMYVYLTGDLKSGWQYKIQSYIKSHEVEFHNSCDLEDGNEKLKALNDSDVIFVYYNDDVCECIDIGFEIGFIKQTGTYIIFVNETKKKFKFIEEMSNKVFDDFTESMVYLKEYCDVHDSRG